MELGVGPHLVKLLCVRDGQVVLRAAYALHTLCQGNPGAQAALGECGVVPCLVRLLAVGQRQDLQVGIASG